jgi:hypothetical protein
MPFGSAHPVDVRDPDYKGRAAAQTRQKVSHQGCSTTQ